MDANQTIQARLRIEAQLNSGSRWFFWIAGLSMINSLISLSGNEWSFIVGLGITQVVDAIGAHFGTIGMIIAFAFDLFVALFFVLFGIFSKKQYNWVFIVGMFVYALDALIFVLVGDWLSIGFHAFALFNIFNGFQASRKLNNIDRLIAPLTPPSTATFTD